MLWVSVEPLRPYWGGMGVKEREMPYGWCTPGHKVWVVLHGWGVECHKVCVLPHGLGGLVERKSKSMRGPSAFGKAFWALGGRGANSHLANRTLRLRIYGYMAKLEGMAK
jgi:hypothetical protein